MKVEEIVWPPSLRALREEERVRDVNAQITDGALDLRVAQQDLHGAQVPRLLVDAFVRRSEWVP